MKKVISITFGFVGTVIGAGFASGKEILLYFGDTSFLSPLLAGLFMGVLAYVFCRIGTETNGNPYSFFGKFRKIFSFFVLISNFLIFSATLAGSEEILFLLFRRNGGAVLTAIATLLLVLLGKKNRLADTLPVAVIVLSLLVVLFRTEVILPQGKLSPLSCGLYAGMNMISGGFYLANASQDCDEKQCRRIALLSDILLSVLLETVYLLASPYEGNFPVIEAAKQAGTETFSYVVLYLSMLTTCTGTLTVLTKKEVKRSLGFTSLGLLFCCLGFSFFVKNVYPFIGTIGLILSIVCIARYIYVNFVQVSPALR